VVLVRVAFAARVGRRHRLRRHPIPEAAGLAAQGRLYLSQRTLGSHLYRIFPKLGVSSRAQLVRALNGSPAAGAPPQHDR
jgi:hypothetical protein